MLTKWSERALSGTYIYVLRASAHASILRATRNMFESQKGERHAPVKLLRRDYSKKNMIDIHLQAGLVSVVYLA